MTKAGFSAVLLAVGLAASADQTARPSKASTAAGVTPGGLLYSVSPRSRELRLYGIDGAARAAFSMQPGESHVLGVADSGARVTAAQRPGRRPEGFDFGEARPQPVPLVFRDARGEVLATREPEILPGTSPAVRGDEAYYVRRVGGDYVLFRTSAAEAETALLKMPADRVRRETGRVDEVSLHATAAGLVLELRGPYRSVYVDAARPGVLLSPDAFVTCSERAYSPVWPRPGGGLSRIAATPRTARLESFDADGKLAGAFDLEPATGFSILPDGMLVAVRGGEVAVLDDRGREVSRVAVLSGDESFSAAQPGLHGASAALREGATGADWVEAALRGQSPWNGSEVAGRDPDGVLGRLARVPDADPHVDRARAALDTFLDNRAFEFEMARARGPRAGPAAAAAREAAAARWTAVLRSAASLAEAGAPAWFHRRVARSLVGEGADKAPAWALDATLEAASSGEDPDAVLSLPDAAVTPALAETLSALEKARLDRLEPVDVRRLLGGMDAEAAGDSGDWEEAWRGLQKRELHLPAHRFPALALSCASGGTPQRVGAVIRALASPSAPYAAAGELGLVEDEEDELPVVAAAAAPGAAANDAEGRALEQRAAISGLLGAALRSDDADERTVAQVLSPLYRLRIDAAAYRRDVLPRTSLLEDAVPLLAMDASLSSGDWTRLMADALAAARSQSTDPVACLSMLRGMEDPYCRVLAGVFGFLMYRGAAGLPQGSRRAEILALARSAEAPAEIRLQAQLAHVMSGEATAAEVLEVWREKGLPATMRKWALLRPGGGPAPAGLGEALERELRDERPGAEDAAVLLEALRSADPAAARRIALERWEKGDVPLDRGERDDHATSPWIAALTPGDATSPRVHDGLSRAMDDERNGYAAAALLSKTGDPEALPRVLVAVRTGCLS